MPNHVFQLFVWHTARSEDCRPVHKVTRWSFMTGFYYRLFTSRTTPPTTRLLPRAILARFKQRCQIPSPTPSNHQFNQISQHSFPNWNNSRLEISPEAPKQKSSYIYVTDFPLRWNSQIGNPARLYMPHVTDVLRTKKQRSGSVQKFKAWSDV